MVRDPDALQVEEDISLSFFHSLENLIVPLSFESSLKMNESIMKGVSGIVRYRNEFDEAT